MMLKQAKVDTSSAVVAGIVVLVAIVGIVFLYQGSMMREEVVPAAPPMAYEPPSCYTTPRCQELATGLGMNPVGRCEAWGNQCTCRIYSDGVPVRNYGSAPCMA